MGALQEQHREHKERRRRMEIAARGVPQSPEVIPFRRPVVTFPQPPAPEPAASVEPEQKPKRDWLRIATNPQANRIPAIQLAVCEAFQVELNDLTSQRRTQSVVWPRHVAMYLIKKLTTKSLPEIGRRFGNRDHTTVLHAVRLVESKRGTSPEIDAQVGGLLERIRAVLPCPT